MSVCLQLSAVSFSDLTFLIVMLPHCLAAYDILALNPTFRYFYLISKPHLAGFANWSSALAIWYKIGNFLREKTADLLIQVHLGRVHRTFSRRSIAVAITGSLDVVRVGHRSIVDLRRNRY